MIATRRWVGFAGSVGVAWSVIAACSGAPDQPPIDTSATGKPHITIVAEAGAEAGGTISSECVVADAGSNCNDLALCGAEVLETGIQGSPPAPAGGAITPGLYVLTSFVVYTGGDAGIAAASFRQTIRIGATSTSNDAGSTSGDASDAEVSDAAASDAGTPLPSAFTFDEIDQEGTGAIGQSSGTLIPTYAGATYLIEKTCPSTSNLGPFSYTATLTTFTLFNDLGASQNVVNVFTRMP